MMKAQLAIALDEAASLFGALRQQAEDLEWFSPDDPLVIDLDGDGIETVAMKDGQVWFDQLANRRASNRCGKPGATDQALHRWGADGQRPHLLEDLDLTV